MFLPKNPEAPRFRSGLPAAGLVYGFFPYIIQGFIYRDPKGRCHTARHQARGGCGLDASHGIAAESVRPVPGPPPSGPLAGDRTMKTETKRHAGREIARCTMKPHRLTCINPPGNGRTEKRSTRSAGQKDGHGCSAGPALPAGAGPAREPPAQDGGPGAHGTEGNGTGRASGPSPESGGAGAG